MADVKENVIEWVNGDKYASCTFNQNKHINRIRKMMEKSPEIVAKFVENKDGSIFCRIPVKAVKLYLKTPVDAAFEDEADEVEEWAD